MKKYFMDNIEYTAADVNTVLSYLVTEGAAVFTDTGDALSDFNASHANIIAEGVTLEADSCLITKSNGKYKINPGACFMPDGSMAEITEAEEITVPDGTACYVYFERSAAENTIKLTVSEKSGGTDTVPLAKISQSGIITDTRKFAMLKAAPPGQNVSVYGLINQTLSSGEEVEVDVGFAGFKYFIYHNSYSSGGSMNYSVCYDLTGGNKQIIHAANTGSSSAYVRKSGSKLIFSGCSTNTLNLEFEVR